MSSRDIQMYLPSLIVPYPLLAPLPRDEMKDMKIFIFHFRFRFRSKIVLLGRVSVTYQTRLELRSLKIWWIRNAQVIICHISHRHRRLGGGAPRQRQRVFLFFTIPQPHTRRLCSRYFVQRGCMHWARRTFHPFHTTGIRSSLTSYRFMDVICRCLSHRSRYSFSGGWPGGYYLILIGSTVKGHFNSAWRHKLAWWILSWPHFHS